MATTAKTSHPTSSKQLLIRGDRLLLLLDLVLTWVDIERGNGGRFTIELITLGGGYQTGQTSHERRFSRCRVERTLCRFISDDKSEDDTNRSRVYDICRGGDIPISQSLLARASGLEKATFDANPLFGTESQFHGFLGAEGYEGFHRFLRAIASGELTEADFKE